MAEPKRFLIVGAGVSGLTLAYWLKRRGFEPFLIDQAPSARPAADITHLFGPGYRIAEKMGLAGAIRECGLNFREMDIADAAGRGIGTIALEPLRDALENRICHLPRAALEGMLLEKIAFESPIRYGKRIRRMERNPEGVSVLFEDHDWESFDLVIGADGVDSDVRRQAFGSDPLYKRHCGYHSATWSVQGMHPGNRIVAYASPGRLIGLFGRGALATAFLVFRSGPDSGIDEGDIPALKRRAKEEFRELGGDVGRLVGSVGRAPDFRLAPVCQIRMGSWAQDRVALVGDAAYCPSMLSGQGASLAMAGAYILAEELGKSGGRPERAFPGYESRMRAWVGRKQEAGLKVPLARDSRIGAWFAVKGAALFGFPMLLKGGRKELLSDPLELPDF